ncbi:MAG: ArsR/SmtB family transcription factor [Candidatus Odinarchaeia archaeon]
MINESKIIDLLAKALGNETRRKILFLLSQNEDYPFSLANRLNVSPRAIMQNLNILEEAGLIEKHVRKSEFGPPRTYYRIKRGVKLSINLTPRSYRVKVIELDKKPKLEFPELKDKFEEINEKTDIDKMELLEKSIELLNSIEKKINELENLQCELITLRDKVLDKIDESFSEFNFELPVTSLITSLMELGEVDLIDLINYHKVTEDKIKPLIELAKKLHLIKEKKIRTERGYYFL